MGDEGLRVEGTSVNVWGLMPRLSCDEARYASQSEAQVWFAPTNVGALSSLTPIYAFSRMSVGPTGRFSAIELMANFAISLQIAADQPPALDFRRLWAARRVLR